MSKTRRPRTVTLPAKRIVRDRPMFYGAEDPITMNKMEKIVNNLATLQRDWRSRSAQVDPRRDFDDECGYPKYELTAKEYHDLIAREPMADIVNSTYPNLSWLISPSMYEDEDSTTETEFEAAWDNLPTTMNPEPSYHAEEKGSQLWSLLLNADILSGESRYGIILIGLDDGKALSEPATPRKGQKLTFLRTFPEHLARINQFDMDDLSPRRGKPLGYQVLFSDPDYSGSELSEPSISQQVHWSRVVHLADVWHTASSSPIIAVPRCRPVLNPILDVRKCRGSSAEIYYKGGFGGHHFGTNPALGADVDVDVDGMKNMYEEYINGLQRAIFTSGMTVDPLAPDTTDPTPYLLASIEAIAMKMRIPKRMLIGNETGERSTEDDRKGLNNTISGRNHRYVTSKVIVPLADRLINLGVLPKPAKGYRIWWPEIFAMSDAEKYTALYQRTQSYALYTSSGMEATVPPLDYMTKFDDVEEEVAQDILESAAEAQEEQDQTNQDLADEHGLVPEVEGFKEPTPDPIEVAKAKASVTSGRK